MFGIKEEKKVSVLTKIFVVISVVIHAPVEFIRKRRAVAQRKLLGAERSRYNMYRKLELETEIHEKELLVLELMTEEVLNKVDHTIKIASITEEITELQLQLYRLS